MSMQAAEQTRKHIFDDPRWIEENAKLERLKAALAKAQAERDTEVAALHANGSTKFRERDDPVAYFDWLLQESPDRFENLQRLNLLMRSGERAVEIAERSFRKFEFDLRREYARSRQAEVDAREAEVMEALREVHRANEKCAALVREAFLSGYEVYCPGFEADDVARALRIYDREAKLRKELKAASDVKKVAVFLLCDVWIDGKRNEIESIVEVTERQAVQLYHETRARPAQPGEKAMAKVKDALRPAFYEADE